MPKVTKLLAKLAPENDFLPHWNQSDKEVAMGLKLIHDAIIDKENQRRPSYAGMSQGQRDGIDCLNYLLDLINDCAGYTNKYYDEVGAGKLNYNQMVEKYRGEKEDIEGSALLSDKHPHCLMVVEGVHQLFRMYRSQNKNHLSVDYLDTLILRLNTGCNGQWFRNHFPVVFETNMSQYFNEQIYNDMKQPEFTFPTIEFSGYEMSAKTTNLSHIFNKEQMEEIESKCGKSIYFTHLVTELIKQRKDTETLSEILESLISETT